jgi:ethanolamine permease
LYPSKPNLFPAFIIPNSGYLHIFIPQLPVLSIAITVYMLFTLINIIGVKFAVTVEFVVTIIAIAGLLLFAGITLPSFKAENLSQNAFPNGVIGIFAALPFALWFFLGIEGVANVAEETINPQKNIIIGFGGSIITLIALCLLTFISSVGVSGWEGVVYDPATHVASDSPLPLVLSYITTEGDFLFNALVIFGLFGLIASFHGIILAAARGTYEFGKYKYLPAFTGQISQRFGTPVFALLFNMVIGIVLLLSGKTTEIIIISGLGALTLYAISSAAQMRLRKMAPEMKRPFSAPLYPAFPVIAFTLSILCLVCIGYYYPIQIMIYFLMMSGAYLLFHLYAKKSKDCP